MFLIHFRVAIFRILFISVVMRGYKRLNGFSIYYILNILFSSTLALFLTSTDFSSKRWLLCQVMIFTSLSKIFLPSYFGSLFGGSLSRFKYLSAHSSLFFFPMSCQFSLARLLLSHIFNLFLWVFLFWRLRPIRCAIPYTSWLTGSSGWHIVYINQNLIENQVWYILNNRKNLYK